MSSSWLKRLGPLPVKWSTLLLPEATSSVHVAGVQVVSSQVFHHSLGGMPALLHRFTAWNYSNVGAFHGRGMSGSTTTGTSLGDESGDGAGMSEGETAGEVTVVGGSDSKTVGGKTVGGEYDCVYLTSRSVTIEVGDWNSDIIRGDEGSTHGWSQTCVRAGKCHLLNLVCSLITTPFIVGL